MTDPIEQEKVALSIVEVVLVIIVTFFLATLIGLLLFLTIDIGLALILNELIILFVPLSYMLYKGINVRRYIGLDINPKLVMFGFASGVILLCVNVIVSMILLAILGESQVVIESNNMIAGLSASPWGFVAVATALGLAGICEEFAFRGFLQSTLTRRISFIPAVLISSFTFGLFHFDPQLVYILSALSAGLVLGYVYHRWNSYIVAVIAHSSVNLLVLVVLLFGY